jgi:gliding motility-associated-like protein
LLATSAATSYIWTSTVGLDNPNIPNPVATAPLVDGSVVIYTVTAKTAAGCQGEGVVRIVVYKGPELYVTSGFTPNGDGKNDEFIPFPVGIKAMHYFKVFNRWGQLLYSTTALNKGWDGRFQGVEQGSGVYVWAAEAVTMDNKIISKKGTITLIR